MEIAKERENRFKWEKSEGDIVNEREIENETERSKGKKRKRARGTIKKQEERNGERENEELVEYERRAENRNDGGREGEGSRVRKKC